MCHCIRRWAVGRAVNRRRSSLVCGLTALLLLSLIPVCGCSSADSAIGATTPSPEQRPRGGTYSFPLVTLPTAISPFASPWYGTQVAHQVFEGLVTFVESSEGTLETVPCLAESWTANEDATKWTFQLRRGVVFQSPVSTEMTARDVVAAFRYGATRDNGCWYAYGYASIAGTDRHGFVAHPRRMGVEALDRYTVRITLKRPFADFPDTLGGVAGWIWPVDYLRRVGRGRFGHEPVGTGPFMVSRLVRGLHVDLVRNPEWWDASSGRPYLDAIRFRAFPSVSAELQAFQKGLIDYTWVPQGQQAASRALPQVKDGKWTAQMVPILCIGYIGFRLTDPLMRGEKGLLLRRAINLACDRRAMIREVSGGTFRLPTGYVPSLLPGWQEATFPLDHDLAKAADLWSQAGSPRLTLVVTTDGIAEGAARILRADLNSAGIPLEVRILGTDAYESAILRPDGPAMFTYGWVADYPSADNFLYDLFHSSMSPTSSCSALSSPEVDRLLEEARATADVDRHLALNREAARLITEVLPSLPLFQFTDYRLTSSRIGGFNEDPMGNVNMWELWVR